MSTSANAGPQPPTSSPSGGPDESSERPDGYLVVIGDPQTGEIDCYGPYAGVQQAHAEACRRRRELDVADLPDVVVTVTSCTRSVPTA